MRRLFWVGVGVTATVVAYRKGRQVVQQYMPATIAERAETAARGASERATAAAGDFRTIFGEARARREAELTAALLAEGQPDPEVTRAARAAGRHAASARATDARSTAAGGPGSGVGHDIDDDEERLGYSF